LVLIKRFAERRQAREINPQIRTPHANPIGPFRKCPRIIEKKAPPVAPPVVITPYTNVSKSRASSDDNHDIPSQSRVSS